MSNSDNSKINISCGGGLCGSLTILFVILKVLNLITWSWLWVFSPIWIPAAIGLVILLICLIVAAIFN